MYFLLLLFPFFTIYAFPFHNKFVPISRKIEHNNLETETIEILQKINGFYGLIGPNLEKKNIKSLFDLFMGNGMIQGVFIENGEMTFVKTEIKTDKRNLETFHPPKNFFPNMMGVSNTAFLQWNNKTYTLFERDHPYEIKINREKKTIETIGKMNIDDLHHFSAHSKIRYNTDHSYIETIDYDVLRKKINICQLDNDFRIISSIEIPMKYIPIIHDFISTRDSLIVLNSAFRWNKSILPKILGNIQLDPKKPAIFYFIDRNTGKINRYYTDENMYIFHYADVYENEREMEIYAPVYDSLDFSKIELRGKYRKITLDKRTGKANVEKNVELEKWNVEFPVPFYHENKRKILLRYVDTEENTGFIICDKLKIDKIICFPGKCICGEPSIVEIDGIPFAIFFTKDNFEYGFFTILNIITEKKIEIPLHLYALKTLGSMAEWRDDVNIKLQIGFHSIYT